MSNKKNNKIYLDYAATTPVDKEVLKEMLPYFMGNFGNASSVHSFGQEAIAVIDRSREKIAKFFNCGFNEIIFTGSATEANNLAILGIARSVSPASDRNLVKTMHFITSVIEHESVLEPLKELQKIGHEITYLPVNKDGFINISDLEKAIKNNTVLVSVIYANNEIGTIQPIKEIGKFIEKINSKRREANLPKIYFHTDAVQALQFLECRPDWLKVDLMTFSGHKIYGPKGIGGLYVRKNTPIFPVISGGGQEFGLRSGTENVASIVGFAKAIELVFKNREVQFKHILNLRDKLLNYIIKNNEEIKVNGALNPSTSLRTSNRLPNNLNLRFPGISNETLLVALDQAGVAVSAGSACSSRALGVSHVLKAIGLNEGQAKESIRITLGKNTNEKEIKKAAEIISKTFQRLKI
ncbi:MAG: cysteine desulfurase family protein [Candidatus Azambacteria bacterium]|nr:cysteine desulfurase family protein [Candidatus Azambacteria bacterium]